MRLLEIAPGAIALTLIAAFLSGYIFFPTPLAIALIAFDAYWLWKSWTIAYHVLKGFRLMREYQTRDWREAHRIASMRGRVLPWDVVKHVVIIPNYGESEQKLRETLQTMALTEGARESVIPVLAMEGAEPDARRKAKALSHEFAGSFYSFLVTYHPVGIPGEVRGKSSNQAWAARCAVEELVGRRGIDIDHLTVTSCDADTQFPTQFFTCLTFKFAIDPQRYRRFWQAPIFFYNNIWAVPSPLRIPNALSGMIHLSRLSRKNKVAFSQSTYCLSMRMAHDVGYWDVDVIPEDWHMFLKCFYRLGGTVDVEPIFLPIGNDGALSMTPRATFVNQYLQVRRWAWGASDIAYAAQEAYAHDEIPAGRRWLRFWYICDNHLTWSTQWFFITLGGFIPWIASWVFDVDLMPVFGNAHLGDLYLGHLDFGDVQRIFLMPCLFFYAVLIYIDMRMRPPAPSRMKPRHHAFGFAQWLLISPITFVFSCLPALDSQVRLMLGKRMEYRVTEKA